MEGIGNTAMRQAARENAHRFWHRAPAFYKFEDEMRETIGASRNETRDIVDMALNIATNEQLKLLGKPALDCEYKEWKR